MPRNWHPPKHRPHPGCRPMRNASNIAGVLQGRSIRHRGEAQEPMFKILILICSVSLSPSECQTDNALDVIQGPDAASAEMCSLHGQAYVAETALADRRRDDEYVKVRCTRSTIGKANVG